MAFYHFRLTPQDAFFFGDERSFGSGKEANYYVKSRRWPQQSTLLGMLRYDLLRRLNLLDHPGQGKKISKSVEAIKAIGEQSFRPQATQQAFGWIKALSCVWLEKREVSSQGKESRTSYYPAPLDLKLRYDSPQEGEYLGLTQETPTKSLPQFLHEKEGKNNAKAWLPWLAKDDLTDGLISETNLPHDWSDAFEESERVGIIKQGGQVEDGDGFYRQRRYRLKPDWCFAFVAEIDDEHHKRSYAKEVMSEIPVGGDRVPFILEASVQSEMPFPSSQIPTQIKKPQKVRLLSDAYVGNMEKLLASCQETIIGDPTDFRNVITQVESTEQYHNLTARGKAATRARAGFSSLYQLIPRGSVFVVSPDNWTSFVEQLNPSDKSNPIANWRKIGYNIFQHTQK